MERIIEHGVLSRWSLEEEIPSQISAEDRAQDLLDRFSVQDSFVVVSVTGVYKRSPQRSL